MSMDRLIKRFLLRNPDGLTDAELLSVLLHFSSEQANEISERLLSHYQNIANLMEADTQDLISFEELDEQTVVLLRLVPELHRRYLIARSQSEQYLKSSRDFGRYLLPYFYGARDELVYLLCLDASCRVICCRKLCQGSVNSASFSARTIAQTALHANATSVVLAHNHPSGMFVPSEEDLCMTNHLREALEPLDILLVDHIIIANDNYTSMRECGYCPLF